MTIDEAIRLLTEQRACLGGETEVVVDAGTGGFYQLKAESWSANNDTTPVAVLIWAQTVLDDEGSWDEEGVVL